MTAMTMHPPVDRAAIEASGTVKRYNVTKGFGFIGSFHYASSPRNAIRPQ